MCWLETQAEANSVRWTLIAGAPTATERDGERLLRVLRKIAEHTPLPLRIGANLGVVFVGDMGHPQRCTFIVMGDATNLAARLMARPFPARSSPASASTTPAPGDSRALRWSRSWSRANARQSTPFSSAKSPTTTSPPTATARAHHAMVGRQAELDRLLEVVRLGGIADLVGDAGSGKTRLWQQARMIESARRWFVTRAEPHEIGSPYLPFRRLLRAVAGIDQRDDEQIAGQKVATFVGGPPRAWCRGCPSSPT